MRPQIEELLEQRGMEAERRLSLHAAIILAGLCVNLDPLGDDEELKLKIALSVALAQKVIRAAGNAA